MLPGAPMLHHKDADSRIQRPGRIFSSRSTANTATSKKGFARGGRHSSKALTSATKFSTRISRRTSPSPPERGRAHPRAHEFAGTVPDQSQAGCIFSASIPSRFTFTPSGSAADSAASRRCCARNCACSAMLENGPPGEMGVHARGGIHRRRLAASDEDRVQGRRQKRRHAHRDCRFAWFPTPAPTAIMAAKRWPHRSANRCRSIAARI